MAESEQISVTDKNLDRLANFLTSELANPELAGQIPSGAHIFHGAYNDMALTQANLKMATTMLIAMSLGLREQQPLVMLFEYEPDQQTIINLSTEERKRKAQAFAEMFQQQSQEELLMEINQLKAA